MIYKEDFVRIMAERKNIYIKDAKCFYDDFVDLIIELLVEGQSVTLKNIGCFKIVTDPARKRRNPKTGETFMAKERKLPRFRFTPYMRHVVNGENNAKQE
jgi:nucleoid DNA-binding protein